MNLDNDQIRFVTRCMAQYALICEENQRPTNPVDIQHSALLNYLLSGNQPFEKPPPKFYSYPCYKAMEGKEVLAEISESMGLVINQNAYDFEWEEDNVLRHQPTNDLYKFCPKTPAEIIDNFYILAKDYPREDAIQKESEYIAERGIMKGTIQRIDGEAPRR